MTMKTMNMTAFEKPVSWDDVATYVREQPGSRWLKFNRTALSIGALAVGLVAVGLLIMAIVQSSVQPYMTWIVLGVIATVGFLVALFGGRNEYARQIRLNWFAADNGLSYSPELSAPKESEGMIFTRGHSRRTTDALRANASSPLQFELGRHTYVVGSGKNRSRLRWRYLSITMERRLPHIVLDATSNNLGLFGIRLSNLPVMLADAQKLKLEGDFNEHFTLYAPVGYERDALYIFAPDLMALLIDSAKDFDAEIIDDTVFFYQRDGDGTSLQTGDKAFLEAAGKIIANVGEKIDRQTDYYADERVNNREANIVAPQGRRLKRGLSTAMIVVAVVYFVLSLLRLLFDNS